MGRADHEQMGETRGGGYSNEWEDEEEGDGQAQCQTQ